MLSQRRVDEGLDWGAFDADFGEEADLEAELGIGGVGCCFGKKGCLGREEEGGCWKEDCC